MDADLNTLATALHVGTDDLLKASHDRAPARPRVGMAADHRRRTGHACGDAGPAGPHQRGPVGAPDTFKGQLGLEHHGGHTPTRVRVRVLQRVLALTAAIWHNDQIGAPTPRSLIAYDH